MNKSALRLIQVKPNNMGDFEYYKEIFVSFTTVGCMIYTCTVLYKILFSTKGNPKLSDIVQNISTLKKWSGAFEVMPPAKKQSHGMLCHQTADSLISTNSDFKDFSGFLNLGVLVLIIANSRVALENVLKYGVLVNPWIVIQTLTGQNGWPSMFLIAGLILYPTITYCSEYLKAHRYIGERVNFFIVMMNSLANILLPAYLVRVESPHPVFSMVLLLIYVVILLKLISYSMVQYWCRNGYPMEDPSSNVTLTHSHSNTNLSSRRNSISTQTSTGSADTNGRATSENTNGKSPSKATNGQAPKGIMLGGQLSPRKNKGQSSGVSFSDTISVGGSGLDTDGVVNNINSARDEALRMQAKSSRQNVRRRRQTLAALDHTDNYYLPDESDGEDIPDPLEGFKTESIVHYPDNINLKDYLYFLVAPTLCYELNFPRSNRIRKRFLIRRVAEVLFLFGFVIAAAQQWILPTVSNSLIPIAQMDFSAIAERMMKLAVPNCFIWLLIFYMFFHSFLNILGEILMFGDRNFYQDWWNSTSISHFWKHWNIPVHKWATRHIYKPMLHMGANRACTSVTVFAISAFFHEYLVSIPLGLFTFWAASGMLLQIPLMFIVDYLNFLSPRWSNTVVWGSIIFGQPLALMAYYHDYYLLHYVTTN